MNHISSDIRSVLQEITHKTIHELYLRFDYILPQHYEVFFCYQMASGNIKLSDYKKIDNNLKKLLEELEEKIADHEEKFEKLLDYSGRALHAIQDKNTVELTLVHNQTSILVSQIKELEQKAYYDDLTGLLNRQGFYKEVSNATYKMKFAGSFFFIDLDNFKYINDTYGHQRGNSFLKKFAELLIKILLNVPCKQRFICRLGGDEFLIAIYEENVPYVRKQLLNIQDKVYELNMGNGKIEPIHFSLGESFFNKDTSLEKAIILADQEMYRNKKLKKKIIQ